MDSELNAAPSVSPYAAQQELLLRVQTYCKLDEDGGDWSAISETLETAEDDSASDEVREHAVDQLHRYIAGDPRTLHKRTGWVWHSWSRVPIIFRAARKPRGRRFRRTRAASTRSGRAPPRRDGDDPDLAAPPRCEVAS